MELTKVIKPSTFEIEPAYDQSGVVCQHSVQMIGDWAKEWRENAVKTKVRRYKRVDRVDQCTHNAVVELDGKPLCRRHAGMMLLDELVRNSTIDVRTNKP